MTTDNPKTGTHALRINYDATPIDEDDWIEIYFDLGALYTTVVMEYDLYIPDGTEPWGGARWYNRDVPGADNNKLLRIWGDDTGINTYGDSQEKIGLTYWPTSDGDSRLGTLWSNIGTGALGPKGSSLDPFVEETDRGNWMHLKLEIKMPSQAFAVTSESDGYMRVTKTNVNGVVSSIETIMNNYESQAGVNHAYQVGLLMGWANASFAEETFLFIDNFAVSGVPK